MKKVAVLIGSKSDLGQCFPGLKVLAQAEKDGKIQVRPVQIASIHRNTDFVLGLLTEWSKKKSADIVITGAGWANHLTGMCDAYLRYTLHDDRIVVLGVTFEDPKNFNHTQAAILSVSEVPGTQVVFSSRSPNYFVGAEGFEDACKRAVRMEEIPDLRIPEPREAERLGLQEAIDLALERQ